MANPMTYTVEGSTSMPGNPRYSILTQQQSTQQYQQQQPPQQQQQQHQHPQQQQQMMMTQQTVSIPTPPPQGDFQILSQQCTGSPTQQQQPATIIAIPQPPQAEFQMPAAVPQAPPPPAPSAQDGE